MAIIRPADLLLPNVKEIEKWSVIACDQFTSQPEYWRKAEDFIGSAPSALNLILPEVYIGTEKEDEIKTKAPQFMQEYCADGTLKEIKDAYVYVERELTDGTIRHGIVAEIDLDAYEFEPEKDAPIKATEKTVTERLVKRLELRKLSSLELPHVLVFYSDPEGKIISAIKKENLPLEYSFELMLGGGRIEGRLLQGAAAEELSANFAALEEKAKCEASVALTIGDGNHSLATAKKAWEEIKEDLSPKERLNSKARYALVELVNVYDEGINIEPIHRVISGTDNNEFIGFMKEYFHNKESENNGLELTIGTIGGSVKINIDGMDTGELVAETDKAIGEYLKIHGGTEDYVHDKASAVNLGSEENSAYVLLPTLKREEIFKTVAEHRILPKKCFSIGHAKEKRYYLEARKIK